MRCRHEGFHGIRTQYDHERCVLVCFWTCESCGQRLGEVRREEYRPAYDPHGAERFLASYGR